MERVDSDGNVILTGTPEEVGVVLHGLRLLARTVEEDLDDAHYFSDERDKRLEARRDSAIKLVEEISGV